MCWFTRVNDKYLRDHLEDVYSKAYDKEKEINEIKNKKIETVTKNKYLWTLIKENSK